MGALETKNSSVEMRWIFWRHKPPSENELGTDLSDGKPEKITLLIDAKDSPSSIQDVRSLIIAPLPVDAERDRVFPRRYHKNGETTLHHDRMGSAGGTAHGIAALLKSPRGLLRRLCHEFKSEEKKRVAYFTRGEYATRGLQDIRMIAPAVAPVVRRFIVEQRTAVIGSPRTLPITTNLELPPARKEG